MDLLKEINAAIEVREGYIESKRQHNDDVDTDKLPYERFAKDSIHFDAEISIKIYGASFHLRELCRLALREHKDGAILLEQDNREALEERVTALSQEMEKIEKQMGDMAYHDHDASF